MTQNLLGQLLRSLWQACPIPIIVSVMYGLICVVILHPYTFLCAQGVSTITFTIEADIIEDKLEEWLQVSLAAFNYLLVLFLA